MNVGLVGIIIIAVISALITMFLLFLSEQDRLDKEVPKISFFQKTFVWCFNAGLLILLIYFSVDYGKGMIPSFNKENIFSRGRLELNNVYETLVQTDTDQGIVAVIKSQDNKLRAYKAPEKMPKYFKVTDDTDDKYKWEKFPAK